MGRPLEVNLQEVEVRGNDGWSETRILVDVDALCWDRPLEQAYGHQGIGIDRVDRRGLSATHFWAMLSRKRW